MSGADRKPGTDETVRRQREIQQAQDREDAAASPAESGGQNESPPRTGGRVDLAELPAQHIAKPGRESEMEVRPRFEAPDYLGSEKLKGSVALITGGDSGIGRAVAVLFAREGADVAIVYLSSHDDAKETAGYVEREGTRCVLIPGDVRDESFCREAVQRTVAELGQLDILVNNAAFQQHAESIEDITEERLDETMRTNVYGYFFMAKAAVKHLGPGGSIINTGSVTGLEGSAHLLDYSATKGAIHAFTKALAQNLLPRGIRVNAIAPGPVWTPLNPADAPAEKVAQFGRNTDMKRAAQPEELAPSYVFLASPVCASYITGIVLPVTGSVGAA